MTTNPSRSTFPLSKIKALIQTSPSISPFSKSKFKPSTRSLSPLNTPDESDTSILEPSDDEFEVEFEVVDEEEGEYTDEQLIEKGSK
jgi:hypothetical protein